MTKRGHLSALSADSMSAYAGRESSDSPRSGRTVFVYKGCPLSAPVIAGPQPEGVMRTARPDGGGVRAARFSANTPDVAADSDARFPFQPAPYGGGNKTTTRLT
jgi:hypothetical protein